MRLLLDSHILLRWDTNPGELATVQRNTAHAEEAAILPWLHSDPFDRMLIAQARVEGLTLVTADEAVKSYAVPCL